ncbi:uncharacterized protein [Amphiura filiformis]|uniref:uncharacterized protein n=1 Tax=Amphiura filiformis TaxID=82378 RepID=UPI003B221759
MLKWIISNQDNINISLSLTPQEIIPSSATPSTPSTDDVSVENANEANGGMEQDQLPVSVENADEENGGMEQDQVPEHLEELMKEVGMNTGDDAAEEREFPVEAIVGEQLDNGIVKYIVKWQGYEKLTLEGQENLADNICFKRYMKSKGRRSTKGKVSKGQRVKKTNTETIFKKMSLTIQMWICMHSDLPLYITAPVTPH